MFVTQNNDFFVVGAYVSRRVYMHNRFPVKAAMFSGEQHEQLERRRGNEIPTRSYSAQVFIKLN